jgi:predicted nicotinamide N-methyase
MCAAQLFKSIRTLKQEIKEDDEHTVDYVTRLGKRLRIQEDPEGGVGGSLWEAARALASLVENHGEKLKSKRAVDLGSGTGLIGLVMASYGALSVHLTDRAEVLPLLRHNVARNGFADNDDDECRVECVELEWGCGDEVERVGAPVDFVVASECIYNMKYAPMLFGTIRALSAPDTVIFFAYASRNAEHEAIWFRDVVSKHYSVEEVPIGNAPEAQHIQIWTVKKPA